MPNRYKAITYVITLELNLYIETKDNNVIINNYWLSK